MLLAFLSLCFFARRITGYERKFCGYIAESEEEFRREFCTAQDFGGKTQNELLAIIQNRTRRDTDSSFQPGLENRDTEPHMFKWMAFYDIEWPVSHQEESCGGVLISDNAVLTAAHCLQWNDETALVTNVTLGVHDIENPGDSRLEIPVERIVVHENFNTTGILDYDVGILFLGEEIVWSQTPQIRPICLPPGGETYQYTRATATGWAFGNEDNASSILQQGDVTVYDQQRCSQIFNRTLDPKLMLCGSSLNEESVCKGNDGGPVISRKPNQLQHELIGILIGGSCVSSESPAGLRYSSVFTNIADDRMLDWIHGQLKEKSSSAIIALDKVTAEKNDLEKNLVERETEIQQLRDRHKSKVLLIGGFDSSNKTSVEIYGNCTDNTQRLPVPTDGLSAAVLGGSVFLCGGFTKSGATSSCYIRVGTRWTPGPSMVTARYWFTLNPVGDRLVAAGGGYMANMGKSIEVMDPVSHTWTLQNYTLKSWTGRHCAVTMSDTTLMLIGGTSSSTQLLNIDTGSMTQYRSLPYIMSAQGLACGLHNDLILAAGGYNSFMSYTSKVLTLDPSNKRNPWVSAGNMVQAKAYHTLQILNGVPTVFGGYDGTETGTIEELQPDGKTWKITGSLSQARYSHASVLIPC